MRGIQFASIGGVYGCVCVCEDVQRELAYNPICKSKVENDVHPDEATMLVPIFMVVYPIGDERFQSKLEL